jgi:ketosteroid isomerase-like protein
MPLDSAARRMASSLETNPYFEPNYYSLQKNNISPSIDGTLTCINLSCSAYVVVIYAMRRVQGVSRINMINKKHKQVSASTMLGEDIVYEYFRLIKNKDINRLLDLFSDDAVIHEPFSNIHGGLKGKSASKPFFEVAMMANDGLQHRIEFERQESIDDVDRVTTLVTFERVGRVQARFTFGLVSQDYNLRDIQKKIQTLCIEFIK